MDYIYLDNNATTQPAPEVVAAMALMLEHDWANPSSVHRLGQLARHRVELARAEVARLIHCREQELIFTSGGTEANNLALRGTLHAGVRGQGSGVGGRPVGPPVAKLITTAVEHPSVHEAAQMLADAGVQLVYLPIDLDGRVDPQALAAALDEHAGSAATILVSIQWANNETGVIQPIEELAEVVQSHRAAPGTPGTKVLLHVDATQAVGKIPIDVRATPIDLLTLAAHKFHGPKGAGALYARTGVRLHAQMQGGSQERRRRGGTENTVGIVGLGAAAELARKFLEDSARIARLTTLRNHLEAELAVDIATDVAVNGAQLPGTTRLWNTSNIGFARLQAEAILLGLSERGVCASAGSACSSGSLDPSPTLMAMGVPEHIAHGSVRFSLSRYSTDEQVERAIPIVRKVVKKLAGTLPAPR